MVTATLVEKMNVATPAGAKGPRMIPMRSDGFPSFGLVNLFKFLETDYAGGTKDEITGVMSPFDGVTPDANNSHVPASGGGGLVIKGWNAVNGPTINITSAFTVMMGITVTPFTVDQVSQSIFAIGDAVTKGFWQFTSIEVGKPFVTGSAMGSYGQSFESGTAVSRQILPPYVSKAGYFQSYFIQHDGAGNYSYGRIDKTIHFDKSGFFLANPNVLVNGGSVQQPVRPGGVHTNAKAGTITYEDMAVYNRLVDQSELIVLHNTQLALAVARGRGAN